MARGTVTIPVTGDVNAAKLAVEFMTENEKGDTPNSTGSSTLSRWATDIVLVSGETPSYCFFSVPQLALEEVAGQVAASYASTPKLFTRARVRYIEDGKSITLITGMVARYQHGITEDSIVGMVQDDRMLLSKVTVFGRMKYNFPADEEENSVFFDAASPLVFEPLSCLDTPYGPLFAPSFKFGHNFSGSTTVPEPGKATRVARNWRCVDVWNYLRNMYASNQMTTLAIPDYGETRCSKWVLWEDGLCDSINWERWCMNLDLENESLLSAMQKTCSQAGPFELFMEPSDWKSTIRITDMSGRKSVATLYMPRYIEKTVSEYMTDPNVIMGGNLVENASSYFHGCYILGDPPTLETTLDSKPSSKAGFPSRLCYGWSSEDEDAFRAYVTKMGDSKEAFLAACDIYPAVFALYRVDMRRGSVWPSGSYYADQQPHWYAKIKPHLLSSKTVSTDKLNTNNTGGNPADWNPLEIPVEVLDEDASSWKTCDRLDGLSISSDRTMIYLDGLRRRGAEHLTWKVNKGDGPFLGSSMLPRPVRLCLAIENDNRIYKGSREDPCKTSNRIRQDEKYDYMVVAKEGDYTFYERYQSYPYGQQIDPSDTSLEFSDKLNATPLFSDLDRLQNHVNARLRDVKRISYSGELTTARLNPALKPGMSVDIRGSVLEDGDNGGAIIKSWSFSALNQQQVIQLASDDRSRIYDIPLGAAQNYTAPAPLKTSDLEKGFVDDNPVVSQSKSLSGKSEDAYAGEERPYKIHSSIKVL